MRPETITVCINHRANPEMPSCGARGGKAIANWLQHEVEINGLPLKVERFKCLGECARGPTLKVSPAGDFFHGVSLDSLPQLLGKILSAT